MLMELVIILFIVSAIALPLQLALLRSFYAVVFWILITGTFIFLMHNRAIHQSYTLFEQQLANADLMGNLMVFQIIEAIGGVMLTIYLLRLHHGEGTKKGFMFFKYFPGIVPFVALFYFESFLFLNIQGFGFQTLGWILAISFMLVIFGMVYFFRWLLVDYDIMLEMKFFLHIIQMIVALIISVQLFRLQVPKRADFLPLGETLLIFGSAFIVIAAGMLYYYIKSNKII